MSKRNTTEALLENKVTGSQREVPWRVYMLQTFLFLDRVRSEGS